MSTVKLTLRPPPNVEFVQGYPGIPPGPPDRPQAAVKGTIEVRVGPQGCKAKWVRIELKKVETLPGGGQGNTFSDFVGPSPVNLWQSSEEYSMLPTQDFPFYIRIPESIPPSTALDKGAGIKYELVASVCVKGKKGFLRRGKSIVVSTLATIPIDKHELHSTWPVYSQPENRQLPQEGVNLTVERTRNCYGPGDRVSIMATLKSDSLHTVILRGFEFTLKETTIFRAGPYATKNKGPQVREGVIGEQKVPVNVTLYGGTQHKAELACIIPSNHQTTSLNSARHIDITYTIYVKALMGTGTHLIMELPVILTNWPRAQSLVAIKRIGTAPSLSLGERSHVPVQPNNRMSNLLPNGASASSYQPQTLDRVSELSERSSVAPTTSPSQFNTTTSMPNKDYQSGIDEFGYGRPEFNAAATAPSRTSIFSQDESSSQPSHLRPSNGRRTTGSNRFTITNLADEEHEQHVSAASPPSPVHSPRKQWLTAEEEKKRLYEEANAKVARVQGSVALQSPTIDHSPPVSHRTASPPISAAQRSATPPRTDPWPSAEEEKIRIYEKAQATAIRTQNSVSAYGGSYASSPTQTQFTRRPSHTASASGSHVKVPSMGQSAGAALYQHAISSMNRNNAEQTLPSPQPSRGRVSPPIKAAGLAFPSAEEEKAALKRYREAKIAVDRTQGIQAPKSPPLPYDTLYPDNPSRSNSYSTSGIPPSFGSSNSQPLNALAEKEKLRRAYEAQDAAALSEQTPAYDSPPVSYPSPDYSLPPPAPGGSSALAEKELLRRRYEAQDAAALANAYPPPQPPPRRPSVQTSAPIAGSSSILSAVEEKARLKAKYEAEERQSSAPNGTSSPPPSFGHSPIRQSPGSSTPPPPPPPLFPRPPAEYIQETQEEDARVRDSVAGHDITLLSTDNDVQGLDLRPFSPFSPALGGITEPPGPPPPLPPKEFTD